MGELFKNIKEDQFFKAASEAAESDGRIVHFRTISHLPRCDENNETLFKNAFSPQLCEEIQKKFFDQVNNKQITIKNAGIDAEAGFDSYFKNWNSNTANKSAPEEYEISTTTVSFSQLQFQIQTETRKKIFRDTPKMLNLVTNKIYDYGGQESDGMDIQDYFRYGDGNTQKPIIIDKEEDKIIFYNVLDILDSYATHLTINNRLWLMNYTLLLLDSQYIEKQHIFDAIMIEIYHLLIIKIKDEFVKKRNENKDKQTESEIKVEAEMHCNDKEKDMNKPSTSDNKAPDSTSVNKRIQLSLEKWKEINGSFDEAKLESDAKDRFENVFKNHFKAYNFKPNEFKSDFQRYLSFLLFKVIEFDFTQTSLNLFLKGLSSYLLYHKATYYSGNKINEHTLVELLQDIIRRIENCTKSEVRVKPVRKRHGGFIDILFLTKGKVIMIIELKVTADKQEFKKKVNKGMSQLRSYKKGVKDGRAVFTNLLASEYRNSADPVFTHQKSSINDHRIWTVHMNYDDEELQTIWESDVTDKKLENGVEYGGSVTMMYKKNFLQAEYCTRTEEKSINIFKKLYNTFKQKRNNNVNSDVNESTISENKTPKKSDASYDADTSKDSKWLSPFKKLRNRNIPKTDE